MIGSPSKFGVMASLNLGYDIQHPVTLPTQVVGTLDMPLDAQNYDPVKNWLLTCIPKLWNVIPHLDQLNLSR